MRRRGGEFYHMVSYQIRLCYDAGPRDACSIRHARPGTAGLTILWL
jgi:hypothetical protein